MLQVGSTCILSNQRKVVAQKLCPKKKRGINYLVRCMRPSHVVRWASHLHQKRKEKKKVKLILQNALADAGH